MAVVEVPNFSRMLVSSVPFAASSSTRILTVTRAVPSTVTCTDVCGTAASVANACWRARLFCWSIGSATVNTIDTDGGITLPPSAEPPGSSLPTSDGTWA